MGLNTRTWCWLLLAVLVVAASTAQAARDADDLEFKAAKDKEKDKGNKGDAPGGPEPSDPAPSDPVVSEPPISGPVPTEPGVTDPAPADPPTAEPVPADPASQPPAPVEIPAAQPAAPAPAVPTPSEPQPSSSGVGSGSSPPASEAAPANDVPPPDATINAAPALDPVFLFPDFAAPAPAPAGTSAANAQGSPTIIVRTPGWMAPVLGLFALGAVLSSAALARLTFRPTPEPVAAAPVPMPVPVYTPTTAADCLKLGHECVRDGDHAEGSVHFARAVSIEPELAVAHFCLGLCLSELGRDEEALVAFENACALDAEDVAVRVHLARACVRLGQHHAAMDALAPLVRHDADIAEAARQDPGFAPLLDHPRFLMLTGAL